MGESLMFSTRGSTTVFVAQRPDGSAATYSWGSPTIGEIGRILRAGRANKVYVAGGEIRR